MEKARLCFITGGVRSGKSGFAEKKALEYALQMNGQLHYLACGRVSDAEMGERILRHQKDRENSPIAWRTSEYATDITRIGADINQDSIILLDCLTTLLDNELFGPGIPLEKEFLHSVFIKILDGINEIRKQSSCLIIVSNELVQEPIFQNDFLHIYGKTLGLLHQAIVGQADEAYLVESGIPLVMKGCMQV
ncbi:Bifunctional adenosylcobalamin biosynthesis protein CobP [Peribacillus sp. Bi96]|uniref:bifunctional adenosylcobinamide kinase/adenosylcobinamide-phosphate guanylyltransferase n=1 Tax=unclassified Peribacillus TaxID=2675266 RepID=UPI001DE6A3E0|nr:bifunctional adenosylcobinamide kinase/adenosylcobinamide-phosphate guanylyltransferase [Peribacillus sp. Bi96]CAH0242055.1 Bifunctional adenosylcobalamin biosynthesis protein CobP [Peribacillus sp. Bi96]